MSELKKDCNFCKIAEATNEHKDNKLPFVDRPLFSSKNFFLLQAKHAVNDGHLLLVTIKHYYSLADLSVKEFEEFKFTLGKIQKITDKLFGKFSIFEHGMVPNSVSQCVEHAHWHILPTEGKVARFLSEKFKLVSLYETLDDAYNNLLPPYILLREDGEEWHYYKIIDSIPSQYVCRLYAKILGKKESSWLKSNTDDSKYKNNWEKLRKEFNQCN